MSATIELVPLALSLLAFMGIAKFSEWIKLSQHQAQTNQIFRFPTEFKNLNILVKTLNEYGACDLHQEGELVVCRLGHFPLKFFRGNEGIYQGEIEGTFDMDSLRECISGLDTEYRKNVQAQTYLNLKQKAAQHNLTIENEEILEDNSILVTLNIGD